MEYPSICCAEKLKCFFQSLCFSPLSKICCCCKSNCQQRKEVCWDTIDLCSIITCCVCDIIKERKEDAEKYRNPNMETSTPTIAIKVCEETLTL